MNADVFVNLQNLVDGKDEVKEDLVGAETWQQWFQTWLEMLAPYLPPANGYEVSLRLTDDFEMKALNSQYRKLDKPTDVLAFAALEVDVPQASVLSEEPLYLGDIVISVDTASRQAGENNNSLIIELAWLAAHGLLHLLGWDHPDHESLTSMLSKQQDLLQSIDLVKPNVEDSEEANLGNRRLAWHVAPNLLMSFKYAWQGISYAFSTQRNFTIHLVIGLVAILLGFVLQVTVVEMALVGLTIALVLVLELLNTAIESLVDLTVKQSYHQLAKIAKDCAAGAVLISALTALFVAGLIFGSRILSIINYQ